MTSIICETRRDLIKVGFFIERGSNVLSLPTVRVVKGGGGYRSRFMENKTALSQFTKNITLAFHASRKILENILENHVHGGYGNHDSREKKRAISHFTGNKKGRSRVTKIPFTIPYSL